MKKVVALALALVSMSAFAGTKSEDYTTCQINAKEAFGADAVVKVKKFSGKTLEMYVTTEETGRFTAVCDRNSFAVSKK